MYVRKEANPIAAKPKLNLCRLARSDRKFFERPPAVYSTSGDFRGQASRWFQYSIVSAKPGRLRLGTRALEKAFSSWSFSNKYGLESRFVLSQLLPLGKGVLINFRSFSFRCGDLRCFCCVHVSARGVDLL
ncbi:hypothetical protein L3X38_033884 [Prunus dulcis]|uniref:Uncharacterized protein n=1 Tax=Prunus dulcis TaxID=3755 RepID=A0AAD4VIX5_PRUDU|nr:hypothetical protein L3X38_033884 [Prunus dulcis]